MSIRIKYIIPEDGDEIDHPNVFNLQPSANNNPTLGDIKKSFPPLGEYHFRFLKQLSPENKVWLDLMNDSDSLPTLNGMIFAKVSRIIALNDTNHFHTIKSATANSGLTSSVRAVAGGTSSPTGNNNKGGVFNNKEVNLLGDDDHDDFHPFSTSGTTTTATTTANNKSSAGIKNSTASATMANNPAKPSRPSGGGGGSIAVASSSGKPAPVNLFDTTEFEAAGDLLDMTSSSSNQHSSNPYAINNNGNSNISGNGINANQQPLDLFDTANFKPANISPTAALKSNTGLGINNNNSNSSNALNNTTSSSSYLPNGLKNSASVDRGIDAITNSFSSSSSSSQQNQQQQQQPMRSVQQQLQQQQQKQGQALQQQQQPLRGQSQTRDAFSGIGDFYK